MITCPWCGTNYSSFQPNCKNCGGPLPMAREETSPPSSAEEIITPPPAPRQISEKYIWRLLLTDGLGITAFILGLLGFIFSLVGGGLTLAIITAFVGIPFLLIGLVFLGVAIWLGTQRYNHAKQVVNVLRIGESTHGRVMDAQTDYTVRINRQYPSVIRYQFQVDGRNYEGNVRTLNPVGASLQAGKAVSVLYLPDDPQLNSIYPHP